MVKNYRELSAERLRRICDPNVFHFKSTAELPVLKKIIGQERAVRATSFGIDIDSPGYHNRQTANRTPACRKVI